MGLVTLSRSLAETPDVSPVNQKPKVSQDVQSKRVKILQIFRVAINGLDIKNEFNKGIIDWIDRKIDVIQRGKNLEVGIVGENENMSEPRTINPTIPLNSTYTMAPLPDAVDDIKRKVPEDQKEHVETALHTLLQAEDLAHALYVRRDTCNGSEIKVRTYNDDGSVADVTYRVKTVTTEPGLNAFILEPQDTPEGVTPEIKMIFVGTKDRAGVARDLEEGAAGNKTFETHQQTLLDSLDQAVGKIKSENVKISIIGHSLGGADTQRMAARITHVVRPDSTESSAPNLRNKNIILSMETSAAPGLTVGQCEEFAQDLAAATAQSKNQPHTFEFRATAAIYSLDIVPTCGRQHILANHEVLSNCAQANVVYIDSKPFQHESEVFKKSGVVADGGIQILHTDRTQQTQENAEQNPRHTEMIDILNRPFRVDVR